MLEDLVVRDYFYCPSIKIHSSSSSRSRLKRLTIEGGHNGRVEVEAPNLQILKICSGNVGECSFKDMPLLREACVDISYP